MATVLDLQWISESVFELSLSKDNLDYRVGDCTLLIHTDEVTARPYSFSSHPSEPDLRFLVRRLHGGFSLWLSNRKPGDSVGIGTPFGWFRPGRSGHEVYVATGTGIAPFLSVLRGGAIRPLVLFYGVRDPEEALFRTWLESRSSVQWAFSRSSDGELPCRRVTDLKSEIPIDSEIEYYLCGQKGMIDEISSWLQLKGVSKSRIYEEAFFG